MARVDSSRGLVGSEVTLEVQENTVGLAPSKSREATDYQQLETEQSGESPADASANVCMKTQLASS